jgi:hypothetical protein
MRLPFRLALFTLAATLTYGQPAMAQSSASGLAQLLLCGRYSFSFSGVISESFPSPLNYLSGVGQFTSNCRGQITGVETENFDGTVCKYTVTGTYQLGSDGTGVDDLTATPIEGPCSSPVNFAQSIAVANGGRIVKVISGTPQKPSNQVTTIQEWVKQ